MSVTQTEPPVLTGEVWRGEGSPLPVPYAVTRGYPLEGLFTWEWYATDNAPAEWYLVQDHERRARIFAAWALAMRSERDVAVALAAAAQEREEEALKRAEKAEALAKAVTHHRDAIRIMNTYRDTPSHMRDDGYEAAKKECGDAYEALLALGGDP